MGAGVRCPELVIAELQGRMRLDVQVRGSIRSSLILEIDSIVACTFVGFLKTHAAKSALPSNQEKACLASALHACVAPLSHFKLFRVHFQAQTSCSRA